MLAVGMIFFLNLGLTLSGFHDGDEAQKAIHVQPRHHFDEFKDLLVPYVVNPNA